MRIAYFDTIAGISGDMTLGAFVHAGVPLEGLRKELGKLDLGGFSIEKEIVARNAISAAKINVLVNETYRPDRSRTLAEILSLINSSSLASRVKERSSRIFTIIGEAEASIHSTSIDAIHFHEVGAVDSIVDIVGACICLEHFNIEAVYSSPIKLGSGGLISTHHGNMPIPTPASVEILKDYPVILTDIPIELTTPTGAGIIKALSRGTLALEDVEIQSIGYGSGTENVPLIPNLLRVFIGELKPHHHQDELVSIETNIDDMNPEIYPFVLEQLLARGAHDAFMIPIIMKKGRPGILLSCLVERGKMDTVLQIIFTQTTTLGLRIQPVERRKLRRESKTVPTSFGSVKVKSITVDGRERMAPEFEECKRIALERNLPLISVYKQIEMELDASRSS